MTKHKKVRFIKDAQSVATGNSFYHRGRTAFFAERAAKILVDGGVAVYTTKSQEAPEPEPLPFDLPPMTDIKGVGEELANALVNNGFTSITDLANANAKDLEPISGIGATKAKAIIKLARAHPSVVSVVKT